MLLFISPSGVTRVHKLLLAFLGRFLYTIGPIFLCVHFRLRVRNLQLLPNLISSPLCHSGIPQQNKFSVISTESWICLVQNLSISYSSSVFYAVGAHTTMMDISNGFTFGLMRRIILGSWLYLRIYFFMFFIVFSVLLALRKSVPLMNSQLI